MRSRGTQIDTPDHTALAVAACQLRSYHSFESEFAVTRPTTSITSQALVMISKKLRGRLIYLAMSLFVGTSHGFVVSLNPVMIGSTTCLRLTSVMWPQRVLRNSWFQ